MSSLRLPWKNCGRKTGQTVPRPVKRFPKAEKWDMHGKTFVAAAGFVLHETVEKVVGICRAVGTSFSGQIAATRLSWNIVCQDWSNGVQMLGNGTCTGKNLLIGRVSTRHKPWKWLGEISMQSCWHGFFQDKCHHCDCPGKIVDPRLVKWSQDRSNGFQRLKNGTCTEKLLHKKSLYTETLTHRRVYTEESWHKDAFTHRSLYAQKLFCTE